MYEKPVCGLNIFIQTEIYHESIDRTVIKSAEFQIFSEKIVSFLNIQVFLQQHLTASELDHIEN